MSRAENFQNVINEALTNPVFAATLKASALGAHKSGVGSAKWITLVTPFATNAKELAELTTLTSESGSCTVPTSYLLQAASTALCTTTTTTTTTSYFCPNESERSKSRQKAKAKKR